MKILIEPDQFIEAICALTELATYHAIDDDMIISDGNDGTCYTPEGQQIFNHFYDSIEFIVNDKLKVHQWTPEN